MDNHTPLEDTNDCKKCGNSGVYTIPNGPDDFEQVFCECPLGQALGADAEMHANSEVIEPEGS